MSEDELLRTFEREMGEWADHLTDSRLTLGGFVGLSWRISSSVCNPSWWSKLLRDRPLSTFYP